MNSPKQFIFLLIAIFVKYSFSSRNGGFNPQPIRSTANAQIISVANTSSSSNKPFNPQPIRSIANTSSLSNKPFNPQPIRSAANQFISPNIKSTEYSVDNHPHNTSPHQIDESYIRSPKPINSHYSYYSSDHVDVVPIYTKRRYYHVSSGNDASFYVGVTLVLIIIVVSVVLIKRRIRCVY